LWRGPIAPGLKGASAPEIVWQVFRGDAVEAREPLLEAAMVGVDVVDVKVEVEVGRFRGRLAGRGDGVKGNLGFARKSGNGPAAVAIRDGCSA
jgi:hypothetical protein